MNNSKKISKEYIEEKNRREQAIKRGKIYNNSVYEVPCIFKPDVKLFIDSSPSIHIVN